MRTCVICGSARSDTDMVIIEKPSLIDRFAWEHAIGLAAMQRIEHITNPVACQTHFPTNAVVPDRITSKAKFFYESFFNDHDYFDLEASRENSSEEELHLMDNQPIPSPSCQMTPGSSWSGAEDVWPADFDSQNLIDWPPPEEEHAEVVHNPMKSREEILPDGSQHLKFSSQLMAHFHQNQHPSIQEMIRITELCHARYSNVFWHFQHWRNQLRVECEQGDTCQRVQWYFKEDVPKRYWNGPVAVSEEIREQLASRFEAHSNTGKMMTVEYVQLIRDELPLSSHYIRQQWRYWKEDKIRVKQKAKRLETMRILEKRRQEASTTAERVPPPPRDPIDREPSIQAALELLNHGCNHTEEDIARVLLASKHETCRKRAKREAMQNRNVERIVEKELAELSEENEMMLTKVAMEERTVEFPRKMELAQRLGISYLTVSHWFERRKSLMK